MRTVNIHAAKTQLSKLVDLAARGEPVIIAKAGKPLVKMTALDAEAPTSARRRGFLAGRILAPADFDDMGSEAVERLFGGGA